MKERCIVIPAIKKNAVIPDQLVKKLAGVTLIERALNTARACAKNEDIIVLTDSEEIALICERAQVRYSRNPAIRFKSWDIVEEMRELLTSLALEYRHCVILRASAPLLTWVDLEAAWKRYLGACADSLVTVRKMRQRIWQAAPVGSEQLLAEALRDNDAGQSYVIETRALFILKLDFLQPGGSPGKRNIPYFLDDRGLEILSYQDWWICERLLERRHVAFVVAGYPAIGMGHVYRALMLAHEISAHKITFVCTSLSELAARNVANRDYYVVSQGAEPLWQTVLDLRPDLVVNDFLDTEADYMGHLRDAGVRIVNFEDEGPGAGLADLVINALMPPRMEKRNTRCGPAYFCLRDEFVSARRNPLRPHVGTLLITFGGTDQHNATLRVLRITEPICRAFGISLRIVAGPGYLYKKELEDEIEAMANPLISFTWATNIMSRMMEGADLAICSAGRTVYELAHMRVPGIVLATHEREASHYFARPKHGFAFAGIMGRVDDLRIRNVFLAMLKQDRRARYWQRQNSLSFQGNKERVIGLMMDQLEKEKP